MVVPVASPEVSGVEQAPRERASSDGRRRSWRVRSPRGSRAAWECPPPAVCVKRLPRRHPATIRFIPDPASAVIASPTISGCCGPPPSGISDGTRRSSPAHRASQAGTAPMGRRSSRDPHVRARAGDQAACRRSRGVESAAEATRWKPARGQRLAGCRVPLVGVGFRIGLERRDRNARPGRSIRCLRERGASPSIWTARFMAFRRRWREGVARGPRARSSRTARSRPGSCWRATPRSALAFCAQP